jgi:two-component system response regulator QseB
MNDAIASLVIVGECPQAANLAEQLELDGYAVHVAEDGTQLRACGTLGSVELVVFAPCRQSGEHEHTLRRLRAGDLAPQVGRDTSVLWLAAEHSDELLRAFRAGADDVARAPWAYAEVLARLRSLLGRGRACQPRLLRHGELSIDLSAREVSFGAVRVRLRPREYALLVHLARDPQRVFSQRELLRDVWGFRSQGATRTLSLHASRLRRRLLDAGAGEGWIVSVWTVGYRLCSHAASDLRSEEQATRQERPWPPPASHAARASRSANGSRPAGHSREGEQP